MKHLHRNNAQNYALLTQEETAKLLKIGRRTGQMGRKILTEGSKSLIKAVESDEVSVAAELASLPKAKQQKIVAEGAAAILQAAKKIKARNKKQGSSPKPSVTL